jgi:hypothetical protein
MQVVLQNPFLHTAWDTDSDTDTDEHTLIDEVLAAEARADMELRDFGARIAPLHRRRAELRRAFTTAAALWRDKDRGKARALHAKLLDLGIFRGLLAIAFSLGDWRLVARLVGDEIVQARLAVREKAAMLKVLGQRKLRLRAMWSRMSEERLGKYRTAPAASASR